MSFTTFIPEFKVVNVLRHSDFMQKFMSSLTAGNILCVVLTIVVEIPIVWAILITVLYMMYARKYRSRDRKRMVRPNLAQQLLVIRRVPECGIANVSFRSTTSLKPHQGIQQENVTARCATNEMWPLSTFPPYHRRSGIASPSMLLLGERFISRGYARSLFC